MRPNAGIAIASTLAASSVALRLDAAAVMMPHPSKVTTGGEDAWFSQQRSFGVFGASTINIPIFPQLNM
jgi:hypothetical protein